MPTPPRKTLLLLLGLLPLLTPPGEAKIVSSLEKREAIRRARVWEPVDVAAMDLLNGPGGENSYKVGEEIPCKYEEKDPLNPLGGHSPKFPCWTASKVRLKVKYDPAKNTEVYGEVAGSRLFWALGFGAERMYSVRILCENCPEDPWTSTADSPRATRVFEPATVQTRLKGTSLSQTQGEGWGFDELDLIDEKAGGATPAQIDALRLLVVFAHHGDITSNQQRILCREEDKDCAHPLMYVTDLGATFGGKDYYTSFRNWSKRKDIWKDKEKCIADFQGTTDKMADPRIGEAGRKFLADLMAKLSDKQIRDLFLGARFDDQVTREFPIRENGKSRKVTVDDWVRVFKEKRAQILDARCPE